MDFSEYSWFFLDSGPGEAAFNMALDEALLEAMPRLGQPVLRFYGWTEPAASFGYFQRYAEVERLTPLRPLVRRPTGGGIVPHDADWTYSLAFPTTDPWYSLRAIESYRRVHEWIRLAFQQIGVEAELAPTALKTRPGQCFAGHEQFDLLWQGRKIAGAAQRRTRQGLLVQGSVQLPPDLDRREWQEAMRRSPKSEIRNPKPEIRNPKSEVHGGEGASMQWAVLAPDGALEERVSELVRQKYSQAAYNRKR